MEAIFIYFVKVILISAVFWLYYLAFLRGKEFHHYNRFYLLITSVFSLALPVIKVDWFTIQANNEMLYNAIVLLNGDYGVEITQQTQLGFWEYVAIGVGAVSLVFILKFGYSVYKLRQIKNKYPKETHADYTLVLTDLEYAPFTFLKNLFWNNSIDFKTQNGSKILRHELTHIKEKHTLDRVYFQILKAIFWFNPIFYLFNREIALIHEYLADQKAIAKHDTKAFAEMLLSQHYTTMSLQGTSPFFSSTIKKRLEMLTKKHNTKFSYARRIWALPLLFALSFIYLVQAKNREIKIENEKIENEITQKNETVKAVNDSLVKVVATFKVSTDSLDNSKIKKVASFKVDSIKPIRANSPSISISNGKLKSKNIDWNKTLIYFNGKEVSENLLVKKLAENPKEKVSLSMNEVSPNDKQKFKGKNRIVYINTQNIETPPIPPSIPSAKTATPPRPPAPPVPSKEVTFAAQIISSNETGKLKLENISEISLNDNSEDFIILLNNKEIPKEKLDKLDKSSIVDAFLITNNDNIKNKYGKKSLLSLSIKSAVDRKDIMFKVDDKVVSYTDFKNLTTSNINSINVIKAKSEGDKSIIEIQTK